MVSCLVLLVLLALPLPLLRPRGGAALLGKGGVSRLPHCQRAVRGELKTALKRVEDLQSAISGELDSENSDNVSLRDHHRAGDDDKARY